MLFTTISFDAVFERVNWRQSEMHRGNDVEKTQFTMYSVVLQQLVNYSIKIAFSTARFFHRHSSLDSLCRRYNLHFSEIVCLR